MAIIDLNQKVENLEAYKQKRDVVIKDIPNNQKEDKSFLEAVYGVATSLHTPLERREMKTYHRLFSKSDNKSV